MIPSGLCLPAVETQMPARPSDGESASAATRQTGCGSAGMRALALRTATRQTRRGNAASGARMLSPNSRCPTLVEGVGADVVDTLGEKMQQPRKPGAGAGADERRPCSHPRRSQFQCAGVINAVRVSRTAWSQWWTYRRGRLHTCSTLPRTRGHCLWNRNYPRTPKPSKPSL